MKKTESKLGHGSAAFRLSACDRDPASGRFRKLCLRPLALHMALAFAASASAMAAEGVFELGTVVVTGRAGNASADSERSTDRQEIQNTGSDTVGAAVSKLPGVSLSRNSRNEEMVYVRGFDARQVPVFVDGVPLYVPYDGYVDFGRFTTFDLAEIRVASSE